MPKLRLHVSDTPPSTALSIYLQDHLAGAAGGRSLARRTFGNNRGTPYEGVLADLARDITEDETSLQEVMSHLGVEPSRPKRLLATGGEHAGRLKLNGQLVGYSPLARVVEFEGLAAGVQAKLHLWRSLRSLEPTVLPSDIDLVALEARAQDQLERIRELHAAATEEAFAGAGR